jgi:hypothetical protein
MGNTAEILRRIFNFLQGLINAEDPVFYKAKYIWYCVSAALYGCFDHHDAISSVPDHCF